MITIGSRVFTKIKRPNPEVVELFRGLPSSNINDEMNRLFCMHDYISLLNPQKFSGSMVGSAVTVKVTQGDNLFLHQALDLAQPGDIIVVDGGSGRNRSLAGEIMMRLAQSKGIAGMVIDGYVRDFDAMQKLAMPVYAMGITPEGPWKNGPGEINTPIACGGQVVFPGDIIVGDMDGVVVIRRQDAEAVAKAAMEKKRAEDALFSLIDSDPKAYQDKHKESTAKRMEGKKVQWMESYEDIYKP